MDIVLIFVLIGAIVFGSTAFRQAPPSRVIIYIDVETPEQPATLGCLPIFLGGLLLLVLSALGAS